MFCCSAILLGGGRLVCATCLGSSLRQGKEIKRPRGKRNPENVLRNQLLLQKRQARLNESPGPLQLPPLQQPKEGNGSRSQDGFIYSFSISEGLIVQNPNKDILNISSAVFRSMNKPNGFEFPSLPMYQC